MRTILLALLIAGCAGPPPTPEQMAGFRSSSSTMEGEKPSGPPILLPSNDVGTPLAGISVSCKPNPSGLNSTCRQY